MKYLNCLRSGAAAVFLLGIVATQAQQPPGPDGPGGPRGPRRGGPGGPQLPPEQQAQVDLLVAALDVETKAVAVANSNLVTVAFSQPLDKDRITKANDDLTKARTAWAIKAVKLFAENQASDKKLSREAVARLIQLSSGSRGGRGFGPGGPGGPGGGPRPPGQ